MKQPKPKRQGPGKPPLSDVEQTVKVLTPMTVSQREKLKRLGGSAWVRAMIDREAGND